MNPPNCRIFAIFGYALMMLFAAPADGNQFYRLEVRELSGGGKNLNVTIDEVRRDEKTSTIKVYRLSGAALPVIITISRGAYIIAKQRGAAYFVKLREWTESDGAWMYEFGFMKKPEKDLVSYFHLVKPLPENGEHKIFSVAELDKIFLVNK